MNIYIMNNGKIVHGKGTAIMISNATGMRYVDYTQIVLGGATMLESLTKAFSALGVVMASASETITKAFASLAGGMEAVDET